MYNQYTVVGKLGVGSFGDVLKVSELEKDGLGKFDARKIIQKRTLSERRMTGTQALAFNEIEIMKRMHHPHIIHIHEIIDDMADTHMYIIMQYLAKSSIDEYIEK
jgi:serine/threonine protein kinase